MKRPGKLHPGSSPRISLISAQLSPATCPSRPRSTNVSAKQHQPCPDCQQKYGKTPISPQIPRSRCTTPCVLSILLYGNETWPAYARQEPRLNSFHLRCLRRILGISWQDRVPNKDVLERAGIPSMFAMLSQRRLRWLGHILRMEGGRLPKDVLYGELTSGSRPVGRPMLRYKDVCKGDMKSRRNQPGLLGSCRS